MLTTRFVTGSPIWVDLGAPDIDGAHAFYRALFGWEFTPGDPEFGGYGMFTRDGRTVAGGMTVPPEQGPAAWTLYFRTPDAEAAATAVRAGGGSVALDPMRVGDLGRMALFTDPTGAGFGVWEPGRTRGLDTVGEPGALYWTELYTPDPVADLSFYDMVFGTEAHTATGGEGGGYTLLQPSGTGLASMDDAFGAVVPLADDPSEAAGGPSWTPYFAVDDLDAAVAEAERGGGKVRKGPADLPGIGRCAKLTDPYGARFAVLGQTRQTG
ncbi:VOC family protein [Streptomyces thermolilacinus]|uniref:Hydroxylase n=1 Tax=Streptomyces thermolilacinus SPC6 TaxID=1306406 RepID=A0A1D3DMN3_9ACTN|nr:VOC family protein [Streptomyces thermolilacinus]OEJ93551.1 hydroxylase [Streptomyces thermolilacinus SPC6]